MQLLNNVSKILNTLFPFRDFVYIAQLEEYRSERVCKWLPKFFWRRNIEQREHVVWTLRARILFLVSMLVWIGGVVTAFFVGGIWLGIAFFVLCSIAIPFFVLVSNYLLAPFFAYAHTRVRTGARNRIAAFPALTIVLIAGSFGKTTTKHFLYELIRLHKKTQMTPGTINTTTGVAQWIMRSIRNDTEVLILEADAYALGDIAEIAHIAPPHIAIITALGDQHMERLKTRDTLLGATAEAFTHARPSAQCITFKDIHTEIPQIGTRARIFADVLLSENEESLAQQHPLPVAQALRLAVSAAEALGVPHTFFARTLEHPPLPERRGTYGRVHGYESLDYSFNITLSTAREAIHHAHARAEHAHKKLLIVTGGITEAQNTQAENQALGALCAQHADHTIIIDTMFAPDLCIGVASQPYTTVDDMLPALPHSLSHFSTDDWFVLFLPELGDLYR